MSKIRVLSLILCALLVLALVACDKGNTEEQTTPEPTTEQVTEAPTEEPTTQEITTEQATTQPESETEAETEAETAYGGRDDFAEDDLNNPYLNLIAVGTSYVFNVLIFRRYFGVRKCAFGSGILGWFCLSKYLR